MRSSRALAESALKRLVKNRSSQKTSRERPKTSREREFPLARGLSYIKSFLEGLARRASSRERVLDLLSRIVRKQRFPLARGSSERLCTSRESCPRIFTKRFRSGSFYVCVIPFYTRKRVSSTQHGYESTPVDPLRHEGIVSSTEARSRTAKRRSPRHH